MPKIWESTVEDHKESVRLAIVHATAKLVHRRGITGLSMSAIATESGISRATLYRYVKDTADAVGLWRSHQIAEHLEQLRTVADSTPSADRLAAVLERYVINRRHRHGASGAAVPHGGTILDDAKNTVSALLRDLIADGVAAASVRTDVPVDELVVYTMAALEAAAQLPDREAALRLARMVHQSLQ